MADRRLGGALCAWIGFVSFLYRAMRQPPEVFGRVMAGMPIPAYFLFPFETMWTHARGGTLKVGDIAPDLQVKTLDDKVPLQSESLWADKASCAGFRQLHLTAFSAGGSRLE